MSTVESTPQASLLLHSLRSVGYSEETAIADIIDNSVSADADEIRIFFDWEKQMVSIVDNGEGMGRAELYKNMQIGSADPSETRSAKDLGRFGMGMKTAAFSLGRKVTVVSVSAGQYCNASWDLDCVNNLGWRLIIDDSGNVNNYLSRYKEHGTAVIISKLDTLIDEGDANKSKKHFYRVIDNVNKHLGLVFHRFISEDGLRLYVNDNLVKPWDPFILSNPATQELSGEEVWDPTYKTCTRIQPYVLPHKTKFASPDEYNAAGGFKGWNRHQGVYLYRNRRLIQYGTWFELIKKEPAFNLARIKIDISSEADEDWKIDIKKSRASLPVYLRDKVDSAIDDCTMRSMKVFNSRGAYSKNVPASPNLDYVWEQTKNSKGFYIFKINKKHNLLNEIRKQLDDAGKERLRAYLVLVENFAPFMRSGMAETLSSETATVNEAAKEKDIADIKRMVTAFRGLNYSDAEILETIQEMPGYSYLKDNIIHIVEEGNA
jgi:hypothetical protein